MAQLTLPHGEMGRFLTKRRLAGHRQAVMDCGLKEFELQWAPPVFRVQSPIAAKPHY